MIDQELPVLRKEDLINILEALFKFSQEPNNAFVRKQDGLYVLDFHQDFLEHIANNTIHATNEEIMVLHDFSIVDNVLHYKNRPIMLNVSEETGNAVQIKQDGLFVPDLSDTLNDHIQDNDRHISNEERNKLNNIDSSIDDAKTELRREIYKFEIVNSLPIDESLINNVTIYCVPKQIQESGETYFVRYVYREHQWIKFDLTDDTYGLFAIKQDIIDNFVSKDDSTLHTHDNKAVIDKFTEDTNTHRLLYNDIDILDTMQISNDENNAIFRGSDDKLYVKDLSSELESIANQASLSKVVLLSQECDNTGVYELEEDISNFNFLMIHYYLKPDDPNLNPYDAKMEMVDPDALTDLYTKHIDYILEHDYGISTYNTKIRFYDRNKMQITYYNHVCIYKIIGVR